MENIIVVGTRQATEIVDILMKFELHNTIIQTKSLTKLHGSNIIVIITKEAKISDIEHIDINAKVIVSSTNKTMITKLTKKPIELYTCGFSNRDFATFSSKTTKKGIVSIQRNNPFELAYISSTSYKDYSILSSILSMVLIGYISDESGLLMI